MILNQETSKQRHNQITLNSDSSSSLQLIPQE